MIIKTTGESLQVFTIKADGPSRMDQARVLRKPPCWIHYNVKTGLSNLAGSGATYEGLSTGSHSGEESAHCLGCFGRSAAEECGDPGRYQGCLGRFKRKIVDGTAADPVNRHVVIDAPGAAAHNAAFHTSSSLRSKFHSLRPETTFLNAAGVDSW